MENSSLDLCQKSRLTPLDLELIRERVLQPLTHEDNRHAKGQPRWRLALVLRYLYKEQMFKAAWRKQNPAVLLHRMEAVNNLATDTACRFVQRQKMHLPGDPQITLRGCYPEKTILLHHT